MKIICARHGETIENVTGITQGQSPGKLSKLGIEQAKKLAERLKDEKIDMIYSSDLARASDTAKEIVKFHGGVPLEFVKDIREITRGELDGKTKEERKEHMKKNMKCEFHKYNWGNGESWEDVQKRVVRFYKKLLKNNENKNILLISHGGALGTLFLHLENKSFKEFKDYIMENTGVSILEKDKITLLNCTKHLE